MAKTSATSSAFSDTSGATKAEGWLEYRFRAPILLPWYGSGTDSELLTPWSAACCVLRVVAEAWLGAHVVDADDDTSTGGVHAGAVAAPVLRLFCREGRSTVMGGGVGPILLNQRDGSRLRSGDCFCGGPDDVPEDLAVSSSRRNDWLFGVGQ